MDHLTLVMKKEPLPAALEEKQRQLNYWGDRCCKVEEALRFIANQRGEHWSKGYANQVLATLEDPKP